MSRSAVATAAAPSGRWSKFPPLLPGVVLCVALALVAWQLGSWLPLIGGPVFGIVLGVVIRNVAPLPATCQPGIKFSAKKVLKASIVVLGLGLSLTQVARTGLSSLAVTLITITVAFLVAWGLGRLLRVRSNLTTLIGVGTAICGGSAIAAATPIVDADDHDTAFSISTIFLFNLIAVLVFPLLGHLMHMGDHAFGLWAGTAINDTSSVVAAGYSFSDAAGDYGTIVKLTRATLIIPVCLGLVAIQAWRHKQQGGSGFQLRSIFPWFILWFVVASAIRSLGWIPGGWHDNIHLLAEFLIIMALTGVGLSADLRAMVRTGFRPIALGLGVWAAVAVSSLAVQLAMHQL